MPVDERAGQVTRAIMADLPRDRALVPEHVGPVVLKHVTAALRPVVPATVEEFYRSNKNGKKGNLPVSGPWIPTLKGMEVGAVIRIMNHEHRPPSGFGDCVTANMLTQSARRLGIKISRRHDKPHDLLVMRKT